MLWHIGNTTVRTPYRLKEALEVLSASEFHGNLVGTDKEQGFARLLNEKGIVRGDRINREEGTDSSDLGRKWRSALGQLGFVTMHLKRARSVQKQLFDPFLDPMAESFPGLSGRPYEVTPSGFRLIKAESAAEQQECFLRALAAYRIPSIFESRYKCASFSPLRFVLEILALLEKNNLEPLIRYDEMAAIVQQRSGEEGSEKVVNDIAAQRTQRENAPSKKKFDARVLLDVTGGNRQKAQTLRDYADLNFRYLKATGLFLSQGRAIAIVPEKRILAEMLIKEPLKSLNDTDYAQQLWNGARLPSDDKINAIRIIKDLTAQLNEYNETADHPELSGMEVPDLSQLRYNLEYRLQSLKEKEFAGLQAGQWQEIADTMTVFLSPSRRYSGGDGQGVKIPAGEAPAYFEWIIWRAFLAIDSLINSPSQARGFKVDRDFLPLSHAPAGGPDMLFEFDDYYLVVEVTLTSSSRQEAAEGEPVRRHVAEIAERFENSGKRVYCLFIAVNINSNTAETFKIGSWYKKDDSKLPLQIVPMALEDFIALFRSGLESRTLTPKGLMELLTFCRAQSNRDAPEWKKDIKVEVERFIGNLKKN